jgi:hypothetical protein
MPVGLLFGCNAMTRRPSQQLEPPLLPARKDSVPFLGGLPGGISELEGAAGASLMSPKDRKQEEKEEKKRAKVAEKLRKSEEKARAKEAKSQAKHAKKLEKEASKREKEAK